MVDSSDRHQPCQSDVGKRVFYNSGSDKGSKRGTLRYCGVTEFAEGLWCGIELDEPSGKNNGCLYGIHYFQCEENHGVFVQANKVELDLNPPKRSHKRTGSGGGRSVPHSPIGQKEFFKSSPPPVKKISTPVLQRALPSQAFNAKLRQLTAKGQKTPVQPLKAFGSELGSSVVKKRSAKPVRSHMRRSSSGENLSDKGLMNGRLVKSASSECVRKAASKEPSPKPFRRSSHENFTAVPQPKMSKGQLSRWPLTSTPVKGDTTSASSSSASLLSSDIEPSTTSDQQISSGEVAFVQTPETPPCVIISDSATLSNGVVSTDDSIVGLQTPVSQLKLQTQNSDFIDSSRIPSPEPRPPHERYQNTLSGSATLPHPLSSAAVPVTFTSDTIASPTDTAATPTETAATPTETAATPSSIAVLPSPSTSINGTRPLHSDGATDGHHSNRLLDVNMLLQLPKEQLVSLLRREYYNWQQKCLKLEQQVSQLLAEKDQLKHQLNELKTEGGQ